LTGPAPVGYLRATLESINVLGPIPATPRGSSLEILMGRVAEIYARIEADQRAFLSGAAARGAALECPEGCGSCCEAFVPDLLPQEAAFMAAWLLESAPELAREAAAWTAAGRPAAPPCPFLSRRPSGARCAIYPARPLVCRLFGAAGVRDRDGRASFRPCARMPLAGYAPVGGERPSMRGGELDAAFGSMPPMMADYAAELSGASPGESADRALLPEALPRALARVALALSLAEDARDRAYSSPHEREESSGAKLTEPAS
jgi:Fe-S-cluster containining protein